MATMQISITALYEYPAIGSNTGEPWNPDRPMQSWARPLEDGEDPTEVIQLYTYVPVTPAGVDCMRVGFYMTKGEASQVNLVPQEHNAANPGNAAYWTQKPLAFPMRETKEGETVKNTPFGMTLTVEV